MSVILELNPEEEIALRSFAEAEGVTTDWFIARLQTGYNPPTDSEAEWEVKLRVVHDYAQQAFLASGKTEHAIGEEIDAKMRGRRSARKTGTRQETSHP